MRRLLLAVVLVFLLAFTGLTVQAIVESGPDILTVLSLLVLALFGFGIVGALTQGGDE